MSIVSLNYDNHYYELGKKITVKRSIVLKGFGIEVLSEDTLADLHANSRWCNARSMLLLTTYKNTKCSRTKRTCETNNILVDGLYTKAMPYDVYQVNNLLLLSLHDYDLITTNTAPQKRLRGMTDPPLLSEQTLNVIWDAARV